MSIKSEKYDNLANKISKNYISKLDNKDVKDIEKAKELLLGIKEKYNLTSDDLKKIIEEELFFPVEILNKELTVLESVVKYLKEEKSFSLHNIAYIIKRDERNIWRVYNDSKKRYPKRFVVKKSKFFIPISIFSDKLSALESVVFYLKEEFSLNYHEIAVLLKRNDRTIWTVYQRARKKYAKQR